MGFLRKFKRSQLAKAVKARDLQLQKDGYRANQGRVHPDHLVTKGVTFRKDKTV